MKNISMASLTVLFLLALFVPHHQKFFYLTAHRGVKQSKVGSLVYEKRYQFSHHIFSTFIWFLYQPSLGTAQTFC